MRAIVNEDRQYPIVRHFKELHAKNTSLLQLCALDRIPKSERGGNKIRDLRRLESKLIIKYGTVNPLGLNKDEELAVHLG